MARKKKKETYTMGMAASQARLISLDARISNLEYQGQQINQERTVLSQQANTLYSSLLTIDVPTPPSTSDFTTIKYTGNEGASTFTLGYITPHGQTYSVDLNYTKVGHYMDEAGTVAATTVPANIGIQIVPDSSLVYTYSGGTAIADGTSVIDAPAAHDTIMWCKGHGSTVVLENDKDYYIKNASGNFVKIAPDTVGTTHANDDVYVFIADYDPADPNYGAGNLPTDTNTVKNPNGTVTGGGYDKTNIISHGYYIVDTTNKTATYITADNFLDYFEQVAGTAAGLEIYQLKSTYVGKLAKPDSSAPADYKPDYGEDVVAMVGGEPCYPLSSYEFNPTTGTGFTEKTMQSYIEAIRDAFPDYASATDDEIKASFSVYFTVDPETRKSEPHFVLTQAATSTFTDVNNTHYITFYDYLANGTYTSTENKPECLLTFDARGRITEIKIPTDYNADGSAKAYKTVKLSAETVTDNNAYQDAYAKYEYAQYEYDKKQQEINAKTSIIQREDKNLELKLTRLDNERNALKTERDAVKKVVDDNIEKSYKTFSG